MTEIRKITQQVLRKFLSSEHGIEVLLALNELIPTIQKGAPHEVQYDAGYAEGYRRCIKDLRNLEAQDSRDQRDPSND
jgi:hypothetical protein